MKSAALIVISAVLLTRASVLGQQNGSVPLIPSLADRSDQVAAEALAPVLDTDQPVVVRGWEIQSILAIKRPSVSELLPVYQQRRRVADEQRVLGSKKGGFLIVQVQCAWATLQPPSEPLWIGRPDVTLVAGDGQEYPAIDALARRAAAYIAPGMLVNPAREDRRTFPPKRSRLLVYFDVPAGARSFSLRFHDGGPVVPVQQLIDLPDALTNLPD